MEMSYRKFLRAFKLVLIKIIFKENKQRRVNCRHKNEILKGTYQKPQRLFFPPSANILSC